MPYLTLFTIPKGFTDPHTSLIQDNALASWQHLGPEVEVLVIGDDPGVAEAAAEHRATHIGGGATNAYGTPLLDWAFATAAAQGTGEVLCYLNADIILLPDFPAALHRLPAGPHLAIGQRWNCDIDSPIDFAAESSALADRARRNGRIDEGRGSDYFAFPRTLEFGLPPFAVGRPGWDNWMIGRTLELGWELIDITPSVTVIHQNHDYGHVKERTAADWEGPEADRNRELIAWSDRYVHSPANATHLLTPTGLERARSPRHMRAKLEEAVALRSAAAPVRRAIKLLRRARSSEADRGRESGAEAAGGSEGMPRPIVGGAEAALKRITGSRALLPLTARILTARLVTDSPRFFLRELQPPSGVNVYRVRENGLAVALRHSAHDSATLAEVFHRHDYLPDGEVTRAIGRPESIVDLGANIGLFGLFAADRWPQARILAFEPDPDNVAVHGRTIAVNGLGGRWRLLAAAAGAHEGIVELASGRAMDSFVVEPGTNPRVPTIEIPILDVMDEIRAADLVKIDIEGSEWEILADPRFTRSPPAALVLEYHPHLCPESDPRSAAEGLLARAGLTTAPIWHRDDGYGMLWAWRS